jgi:hypothetical protein
MRTESSSVLAFRIFVMLACLIVVPMAAIFGSAFPDVVKSVLVDRMVYWATGKWPESRPSEPPAGFSTVAPTTQADPRAGAGDAEPPRWGAPPGATTWQGPAVNPTPSAVMPAAAAMPDSAAGNQQAAYDAPNQSAGDASATGAPAYAPSGVTAAGVRTQNSPVDGARAAAADNTQPDPFTAMERKLRAYGATYYLLETWGNDGELFRFHCKMAIGNNPNYTRHFEATDRDALRAMSQVLSRVEAWRGGRPQ